MNRRHIPVSLLTVVASVAAAQTAAKTPAAPASAAHPPVHRPAAAASTSSDPLKTGGCVPIEGLSPKIPALPAGAPCARPLFTLTSKPSVTLDYASPMVSEALRKQLSPEPVSIALLYVDTKVGTGELAKTGKYYTVNYTGYLTDGTKFDSSEGREPITFPYGQHAVIAGWDTGFEGMHVGGKRRLFVPYQLAYGEQGKRPTIPPRAQLVFDVELVAQSDTPPEPKTPPTPPTSTTPAPEAKPSTSPAGAAATPPVNSSTPASSTQPATTPQPK